MELSGTTPNLRRIDLKHLAILKSTQFDERPRIESFGCVGSESVEEARGAMTSRTGIYSSS